MAENEEKVEQRYFTIKQVAKILGVSFQQVYSLCYEKKIESFVLDGTRTRRISKEALDAYIERSKC